MIAKDTLVWERQLGVDPKTVREAIATREGLSHWFMSTKFEIVLGGPFSFERGWSGTITRIEPGRLIQFNPDADSEDAYLRFEIESSTNGSLFRLTDKMPPDADPSKIFGDDTPEVQVHQPGGIGTHWSGVAAGYHGFVDALEAYLTGQAIPFDHDDLAGRYSPILDEWHSA
jgi:uncharacterized protein YndB with AHSA1/START domain